MQLNCDASPTAVLKISISLSNINFNKDKNEVFSHLFVSMLLLRVLNEILNESNPGEI